MSSIMKIGDILAQKGTYRFSHFMSSSAILRFQGMDVTGGMGLNLHEMDTTLDGYYINLNIQ